MNIRTTLLTALFIAIPGLSMALDDVQAKVVVRVFQCKIGITDNPTSTPSLSTELFRADKPGLSICVDVEGRTEIPVDFVIIYEAGVTPYMKARAYPTPGCIGTPTDDSANGCHVNHISTAPYLLPSQEESP